MNRLEFKERIKSGILTLDGAMGTMIYEAGLAKDAMPELAVFEMPEKLGEIHGLYVKAGADMILTNTLGATPLRLAEHGIEGKTLEVNREAIRIARGAAGDNALVGLCVGSSGSFIKPVGEKEFDEIYENFAAQAKVLNEALPDAIVFETFSDVHEMKAAILAFKEANRKHDLPIIAHLTFAEDGRTVTGTDPESFAVIMEALDVDVIGVNCSVGPEQMLTIARKLGEATDLPISVEPNAGLPEIRDGKPVYSLSAKKFAGYIPEFIEAGANIIGSCCGSTPEFTKLIKEKTKGALPVNRKAHEYLRLAGRTKAVSFTEESPRVAIGERINPAGRKDLKIQLRKGDLSILRSDAVSQEKAGAAALDVNVSGHKIDEKRMMIEAVETVQQYTNLPLLVDNSNPEIVEEALKRIAGKAMINSTSAEVEKLEPLTALAVKYGAALVGVCLDENGIPETPEVRVATGERILEYARSKGLAKKDIALDGLVLSASTGGHQAGITLETVELLKERLGVTTILGISNISFGLPNRPVINAEFMGLALRAGLDLPIVDPTDKEIKKTLLSYNLLMGHDEGGRNYIANMVEPDTTEELSGKNPEEETLNPVELVRRSVIHGEKDNIEKYIESALEGGTDPLVLTNEALVEGMRVVGERFNSGSYFLPQVILSAETMKKGFAAIKSRAIGTGKPEEKKGKVIFATVKGDVHDLGKNIVITLLESYGFEVIDLGKSVDDETVLERAEKEDAFCIALSALMTTTMGEMKTIAEKAAARGLKIPVIIGGAVITKNFAEEIGASYGRDAIEAVKIITGLEKGVEL